MRAKFCGVLSIELSQIVAEQHRDLCSKGSSPWLGECPLNLLELLIDAMRCKSDIRYTPGELHVSIREWNCFQ